MLESVFVTHDGPSQKGIQTHYLLQQLNQLYSNLLLDNEVVLIGC